MIISQEIINNLNSEDLALIPTKTLVRKFGRKEDNVELYIYDLNDRLLLSREDFRKFKPQENITDPNGLYNEINIDYTQTLKDFGFTTGQYKLQLGFYRKLIVDSLVKPFFISEISPSRKELRIKSDSLTDENLINGFKKIIGLIEGQSYFREFILSFRNNTKVTAINFAIDSITEPTEILVKLYEPLPVDINVKSKFRLSEEIIHPIVVNIDLGEPTLEDLIVGEKIKGPNLRIDTRLNSSKPSSYRNYDQLLGSSISSSFANVQSYVSGNFELAIDFSDTNTNSGYHFENFIHFSSAVERLKNFNYKLTLLESYDTDISEIDTLEGDQTSSAVVIAERDRIEKKKNKLLTDFDAYERFLYFESGTYSWPKENSSKPFTNVSTTSPSALTWLGSEDYNNNYYGGQLLSGSEYDDINIHRLTDTLPEHIVSNTDNDQYTLFVNMIGEHFDRNWIYINHITNINKAENKLNRGVSKNLVSETLERAGLKVFDQFENENLFSYIIGDEGASGNFQYQAPTSQSMVSASNAGSIPKKDITSEVHKRLYHNLPYLLKTKGTERGMKALISCYGIPESILHIKEYGGPVADKTTFRTFSYPKFSKALRVSPQGLAGSGLVVVKDNNFLSSTKTIQVRAKLDFDSEIPGRNSIFKVGPTSNILNNLIFSVSQSLDTSDSNSGSLANLNINYNNANNIVASSSAVPIYNGGVWNFTVTIDSGSSNTASFFATQTTPNLNTYMASCSIDAAFFISGTLTGSSTGIEMGLGTLEGNNMSPAGGQFEGNAQEFRVYTELLTKDTIASQSLSPFNYNGNSISSSFEHLYLRVPMGSNLITFPEGVNYVDNQAPNSSFRDQYSASIGLASPNASFVDQEETHHLTTPDTVGKSMVSDKVRLDTGEVQDNILSPFISSEESVYDRQPNDFSDLGIFFSPTFEVNEDIIYTLGGFRMDDYIGDPRHYISGSYPDLDSLKDIYFQKIDKKITNIFDYIKLIQQFDHTLFKMIEQFAPAKANLKTGLVIEPHYLERHKINGTHLTTETINYNLELGQINPPVSSEYLLHEGSIDVEDIVTEGTQGSLENNAIYGRRSDLFFNRIKPYDQLVVDNTPTQNPNTGIISEETVER